MQREDSLADVVVQIPSGKGDYYFGSTLAGSRSPAAERRG
jgi:hypothetical protein